MGIGGWGNQQNDPYAPKQPRGYYGYAPGGGVPSGYTQGGNVWSPSGTGGGGDPFHNSIPGQDPNYYGGDPFHDNGAYSPPQTAPPAGPKWKGGPPTTHSGWYGGQDPNDWTPKSQPGVGEEYWGKYGDRFTQPNQANQYWNGVSGFFANPSATGAEDSLMGYANALGGHSSKSETAYDDLLSSGAYSNPSDMEKFWQGQQGMFSERGFGEDMSRQLSMDSLRNLSPSEQYNLLHQDDFSSPGYLERNVGNIAGGIDKDTRNAEKFWSTVGNPNLSRASYTEGLANNYRPEASYSEQFLTGGGATGGLDSLYDRLYNTGSRQLDDAAAARGGYNSGAALRASEELQKDLGAQHVRDVQAASTQADSAKMARLGYGLDLMQGADTSLRGRVDLGMQGSGQVDQEAFARAQALQALYSGVGGERRSDAAAGGQLAAAASEGQNNRLNLALNAGRTSEQLGLDRGTAGATLANLATNAGRNRNLDRLAASGAADTSFTNRIRNAADLTKSSQDMTMNRLMTGGQLSNNVAGTDLAYLTGGSAASLAAQNAQRNRENDVFNNTRALAEDQAGTTERANAAARSEQTQLMLSQIEGLLKSGNVDAQTAAQLNQLRSQLIQMGIAGAGAARGDGGGAGAGWGGNTFE